jgi:hypothetical protein
MNTQNEQLQKIIEQLRILAHDINSCVPDMSLGAINEVHKSEIERLRELLKDAVNSGNPMGWTEPGKYCKSGEQISLREAILNELNGNTQR